jgi:hypothetical protein
MAAALTFDEASHTYRVGERVVPSVTQLLAPIKPDFSMVPPGVLERKRQLGTDVHLACELDDDDDLGEVDDEILPYLQAWRQFRADTGAEVLANERQLYHPTLMFAGTLDRMMIMPSSRETWLLDLKTSIDPHPSYGVQLAGYRLLIAANVSPEAAAEGPAAPAPAHAVGESFVPISIIGRALLRVLDEHPPREGVAVVAQRPRGPLDDGRRRGRDPAHRRAGR